VFVLTARSPESASSISAMLDEKGYIFHVTILPLKGRIVTRKISLGPNETKLLFGLEKEDKTTFNLDDVTKITGFSQTAAWKVIHRLSRKKRIVRVERGKYLLVPARAGIEGDWSESPFSIIPHIIDEYYVGFWTAMNHWHMTEQMPITIFVATTKRKRLVRYSGQTFKFITISKKKFFAFTEEKIGKQTFNVSTREKTIADALVFPQYCGGISEVTKGIWNSRNELDWRKLNSHIKRMNVDVTLRRLAYILTVLKIRPEITKLLENHEWYGLRFLDQTAPKKALGYSKKFGLILNVPDHKLTSWRGT
jgi:predicted transcriptional regulator of viral defense system